MHNFLALGRGKICCTPGYFAFAACVNAGCNLDANIYVEAEESSAGMDTKCRTSAADVPTYKFSSIY